MDVVRTGTWGLAQPGENYMGSIDTLLVIYPEIAFDSTLFRGTSVAGTVQITQLDLFTKVFSRNHALNLTDVMLTDKEAINNQVNTFWKSNEGHSYFINLAETSALDEVHNAVTLKSRDVAGRVIRSSRLEARALTAGEADTLNQWGYVEY